MKKVNLADFSDLLFQAQKCGYSWNEAHKILVDDQVPPMNESNSREYYMSDIENNEYGWSEDTLKIVKSFMKSNRVKSFTVI